MQNDKKLSRADDCLAIKGNSHATLKNANNQKVINNVVPFFITQFTKFYLEYMIYYFL